MKAATLESKFPLLAVENGCIVSKEADVTVAFRVELPELFSVTGSEYEAVHSAWHKAVKVLPEYSIVHKQDFFIEEKYRPETDRDDLSFLSRSFERHFNERPFLNHFCYLFLTKTTKARSRQESTFSTLCKGRLVPKEIEDRETVTRFLEAVGQFEKIMNDSGFVTLRRLTTDEITGTERSAGIVEKYLSLSQHDTCRARWRRTAATSGSRPTARTAACRSPPRWACCWTATTATTSTSSSTTTGRT